MSRIRIVVDSRIRIPLADATLGLVESLKRAFTHANPQREMLRRIGKPFWGEPEKIETWTEDGDELTLPRGGMKRLRNIFAQHGVSREVSDQRVQGDPSGEELPAHRVTLHAFQEDAVQTILARESGIVRAPTGSGKSVVAFAAMSRAKVAALVIVYNVGLFDQWVKRAGKELGLHPNDIGVIRGRKRKLRGLTIAMQQTLSSRGVDEQLRSYFGMVIADEVHRAAAQTEYAAVDPFPARYRIGISADHRRKDGKVFIIEDLFGDVIVDVPRKDLITSGHVLEVQIRVIPTDFEASWYGMPTEQDEEGYLQATGQDIDTVRLNQEMGQDLARNELILSCVIEEERRGEQVLVFSHVREHCLLLDQQLVARRVKTGFLIGGEDYRVEFRKTVAGLEGGTTRVGVGTFQAVGQALDLPTVSIGVCATPIASNRQVFNQVRGRLCRTLVGKKGARLFYPWDRHVFGRKHLENIVAWNSDVVVCDQDGEWVDGREYLKGLGS